MFYNFLLTPNISRGTGQISMRETCSTHVVTTAQASQLWESDGAKAFRPNINLRYLSKVIRNTTISENSSNIVNGKRKALSSLCSTRREEPNVRNFPKVFGPMTNPSFRPIRRTSQSEANPKNYTGTRLRAASKSFGHCRVETYRQRMKFKTLGGGKAE